MKTSNGHHLLKGVSWDQSGPRSYSLSQGTMAGNQNVLHLKNDEERITTHRSYKDKNRRSTCDQHFVDKRSLISGMIHLTRRNKQIDHLQLWRIDCWEALEL